MRQLRLLVLVAAAAATQQAALQTAAQDPSPPVFRTGTRLVQVDVIAREKNGPATGLTQDDFTLFDNGKPQRIAVFSVKSKQLAAQKAVPLPPGTVSNRLNRNGQPPATSTVLLIDRANTPLLSQRYADEKVVEFLERRGSQDQIGIYMLGTSLRIVQDLTDDPERINRAINSLKPQNPNKRILHNPGPFEQTEPEITGRPLEEYTLLTSSETALNLKQALKAIAAHLAKVPGRKNLIWITGSFPLIVHIDHMTIDYSQEMQDAARALSDANVALYGVDARGLDPYRGLNVPGIDTLNDLAGLTGGRSFYADNGIGDLIQEAVEDSELIYTLGFYPSEDSQNGDWHRLKVSTEKHGVHLRYRENYLASKPGAPTGPRPTLSQMFDDPLDSAEIGVLAQSTPDPSELGLYHVRVTVDLHDVHLEHQEKGWTGAVNVALFIQGSKSAKTITHQIEIPEDQLAPALETGYVIQAAIGIGTKPEDLRVVARDEATGAAGSLRIPLRPK